MARPLSKTKKENGALYTRFPKIEAAINVAINQDLDTLCRRAKIRDQQSPEHLPSECLVHLIRDAHRGGDDRKRDALLRLLFERCHAVLNKKVDRDIPNAVTLRKEILNAFGALFAIDGSAQDTLALDHFEVRFNQAFHRFRIIRLRPVLARLGKQVEIPDSAGDAIEHELDNEVLAKIATMKGDARSAPGSDAGSLFRLQI
jgi:hypothetical protein